jgi:hypothetical protein
MNGAKKIEKDLDLVRFIRAKRMHGFGLALTVDNQTKKNSALMAYTRPIRENQALNFAAKTNWNETEGIDKFD